MLGNIEKNINNFINLLLFKIKKISYPKTLKIDGCLRLRCDENPNIHFGEKVTINSSWKSNPSGGGQTRTLIYIKSGGKLYIGNNVGISNSSICASKEIVIGDNVNIGVNCIIYDSDFHSIDYVERMSRPDKTVKVDPVRIEQGAWIGGHVIILKGVTIGHKSVIGAGSVVTKNVPSNELWAGNPARFIKKIN